uniref:Organic solvent tolerance protein n=1 Tax=uncultured bacterium contig00048 TaxID=1181533 RepID=A0A806KHI2_9BACT|nr:organic solvent tolerance protein [uncultured bacterium contig00048]
MPLLLILIFCGLAYSQDFFRFDLGEREQADTLQSASGGWLIEDGSNDTLIYHAVDLEYDVFSKTFNLNSKAQLKYKTATLNGDTIIYKQAGRTIEVIGNPIFRETSQPTLASYRMKYNLDSKVGEIIYGTSFMDNQQFNGILIRAVTIQSADTVKEQRFLIERGDFSTCANPEHQHYSFYSRRMVLKPKESVTARPVVLNMGEVPVAILPLMITPMRSGRQSGLLTPKFGGDQAQGFFMNNLGYYYAPNDYLDEQIFANVIEGSSADFTRSNLNSFFRYNRRYDLDGYVNATGYFNNGTFWQDYDIHFRHSQNITPDRSKTLNGSGSFVSRKNLRQENGMDERTVLDQQANAEMTYFQRIDDNKNITIKLRQEYNLLTGLIRRQNPDIQFRAYGPLFDPDESGSRIDPPFWEKINYSYSNNLNNNMVRSDNARGVYNLGFTDNLSLNLTETFFNVLNLTPSLNFTGNWTAREYTSPDTLGANRSDRFAFDPSKGEYGHYYLKGNASLQAATKLYGIWRPEWGRFVGVRHTLSPTIGYTYAPELDTNYAFYPHPSLGQSAFQQKQQTVNFRLGNDFDIKYLTAAADTISEEADMDDYSKNLRVLMSSHSTSYNAAADSFHWSDISSNFGIQVFENYIFAINTTHKFYHLFEEDRRKVRFPQLTAWSYGFSRRFAVDGEFNAGLPSKKGRYESKPWNAAVDYSFNFTSNRVGRNTFRDSYTHYAIFSAAINPTRKWNLQYSSQYSFEEGQFTSHSLQFHRELHCWKMEFTWRPAGAVPGWNFVIYVLDLPDVRLSAANTKDYYDY